MPAKTKANRFSAPGKPAPVISAVLGTSAQAASHRPHYRRRCPAWNASLLSDYAYSASSIAQRRSLDRLKSPAGNWRLAQWPPIPASGQDPAPGLSPQQPIEASLGLPRKARPGAAAQAALARGSSTSAALSVTRIWCARCRPVPAAAAYRFLLNTNLRELTQVTASVPVSRNRKSRLIYFSADSLTIFQPAQHEAQCQAQRPAPQR